MASHEKRDDRAQRQARDALVLLGREVRIARLGLDLSQAAAGQTIGVSACTWGRIERAASAQVSVVALGRVLAVVGLDLHVRAYPGGQPLRDTAHVRLIERLRTSLAPGCGWRTEVPMPIPGDQRAWDAVLTSVVGGPTATRAHGGSVRTGLEAETRARDAQALQRRLALKQRDGGMDHVVLLLADTRHNRSCLRSAGEGLLTMFPVPGRRALEHLGRTGDPGGNAIILL